MSSILATDSLAHRIDAVARNYGDEVAQTYLASSQSGEAEDTLQFAELAAEIRRRAAALHALGLAPGAAVTFLAPLSAQSYPTLLAIMSMYTAAPVNYFLEADALIELIRAARTQIVVTGRTFPDDPGAVAKIDRIRRALPHLRHVAFGPGESFPEAPDLESLRLAQDAHTWPPVQGSADPGRVVGTFLTGGTTGLPRLVPHTQAMYLAMLKSCGEGQGTVAGETVLSALPLFHTSGALQSGLVPLLNGARVVIPSPKGFRDPSIVQNYWSLVARQRITVGACVPTVLAGIAAVPCDFALPSLKRIVCGAAPLPVATIEAVARRTGGVPVIEGWGMTETCGFSILNPIDRRKVGSVGLPFAGVQAQVRSLDGGTPCETDSIGELTVRGDIVIKGYVNDTPDAFTNDGWLRTGDLARIDADGFVWIVGRMKDMIIRGGHNIDPAVLETPAYEHPAVQLAAAVGRPDKYAGEVPIVFVQLKTGATADPNELESFICARVRERAAAPKAVHIVPAIPLSGPGKISKLELRYEAIRAVFQGDLNNIERARAAGIIARVGEDSRLGIIVTLECDPGVRDPALEGEVKATLQGYAIPHRWA